MYEEVKARSKTEETQAHDHTPLTPVRDAHRFDVEALERYMGRHVQGFEGNLNVQQFEGGQSNPTYLLDAPSGRYVLRKQPPGELLPSAHQVDREYRVMYGLGQVGAPVPKMLCLCLDRSILGTDFYLMDWVEGRVFTDTLLPSLLPEDRREIYLDLMRVLGQIHSVNYQEVGLQKFGQPANYVARQISRWSKQYLLAKTVEIPAMEHLMEWLPAHIPEEDAVEALGTIVHGDYRLGNTIIHPTEPRIVAVLDWELSTIGNPLSDLSYLCQEYHGDVSADIGLSSPRRAGLGIPSESELIAAYSKAAGRESIENWEFYLIFNMFRSAAIAQGVYKRGLDGNASSETAREFSDACRARSEQAWQKVRALPVCCPIS